MSDPIPTFAEVVRRIRDKYPNFAYIHVLDPHTNENSGASNDVLRELWGERAYIANAGFERATAIETVEKKGGLISFARHFLANVRADFQYPSNHGLTYRFLQPDLPLRLKENIELAPPKRETSYTQGAEGYTDYAFAAETGSLKSRS